MDARAYVESHAREISDDLKQWLAISLGSADPTHHSDVRRSAEVSACLWEELATVSADLT